MYSEKVMNISVKVIMDTRLLRNDGTFPIRIRVIHNRISKEYNTGKCIHRDDWDKLSSPRQRHFIEMKVAIKRTFDFVLKNVEDLLYNDYFSFDNLNIRLGRISAGTINSLLKSKIEILRKSGHIGTMDYYADILRGIEKYSNTDLSLEEITVDWLKKYDRHLQSNGLSYATIAMRMRGIRTIINEAITRGLLKKTCYPFGLKKYEIREYKSEPKALSLEQIRAIADYDDGDELTMMYRDIWLFIFFCNGINVADLVNLKFRDIIDGEINFIREKTKHTSRQIKPIKVCIISEMQAIIDRWGNEPLLDNYIFPLIVHLKNPRKHKTQISGVVKRINEQMNKIGYLLEFGRITTYVARHSFATALKQNGVNLLYIAEALGHTDIKSTSSYLASFKKEERMKNALILTKYTEFVDR